MTTLSQHAQERVEYARQKAEEAVSNAAFVEEACEAFLTVGYYPDTIEAARAAIAKARGE